jgi:arsenite methyltransferase
MNRPCGEDVKRKVRERYGNIAAQNQAGCGQTCCASPVPNPVAVGQALGYSSTELAQAPEGANLGLGCGNPGAIAALRPGETVLDLGAGGGFDCFLAAKQVGETGRVIGVDMTPEMVSKARENLKQSRATNVEFRLGEIEHLPVADSSVDVIISNCVINLATDKAKVYAEAFRALRPGGRLAISDIVALGPLSEEVRSNLDLIGACAGGAETVERLEQILVQLGFKDIVVKVKEESRRFISQWFPGYQLDDQVASAEITAIKPKNN